MPRLRSGIAVAWVRAAPALLSLAPSAALAESLTAAVGTPRPSSALLPASTEREGAPLPLPGEARLGARATEVGGEASPGQPFGGDLARAAGALEVSEELGLARGASAVTTLQTRALDASPRAALGAIAGLRLDLLPASATTRAIASGGLVRDLSGAAGAWGRLALAHDFGSTRLTTVVHAERRAGHDSLDVTVSAGASRSLSSAVRVGVEYVGQDLEGLLDPAEGDGGARQFVRPSVAARLWRDQVEVWLGPAIGVYRGSLELVASSALLCRF